MRIGNDKITGEKDEKLGLLQSARRGIDVVGVAKPSCMATTD